MGRFADTGRFGILANKKQLVYRGLVYAHYVDRIHIGDRCTDLQIPRYLLDNEPPRSILVYAAVFRWLLAHLRGI